MEKTLKMNMLFDFYGPLLTERQQDIYQMYFFEDLSLSEVGQQLSISRQAVYDVLKRSGAILEEFESKLKLVQKYELQQKTLLNVQGQLEQIREKLTQNHLVDEVLQIDQLQKYIQKIIIDG